MDMKGITLHLFISCICLAAEAGTSIGRKKKTERVGRPLTDEERLITDLFKGYNTDARAVKSVNATVTVEIQFLLLRIQRLDERSQVLFTTGLVIAEWTDERLTWDPQQYSNLSDIVVRANRIWLPELAIINGADDMIHEFEKIRVLISSNGNVHWEPGGVFATTCDIDITYFPFDEQACPIEIGAWAYKSSRMNLTNSISTVEMQEFKLNGEWRMRYTSANWKEVVLPCCPDIRYSKVVFVLHLTRRCTFYVMNIMLPCALLSILILIVFCVPPEAGEKISSGISVLLAFTVFLLMLADNVPRTSLDVPILVMYLGVTMALGTVSVCLSVLVLNIHHHAPNARVPRWARVCFLRHCARLCGFIRGTRARRRVRNRSSSSNDISKKGNSLGDSEDPDVPPDLMENQSIRSSKDRRRRTTESFMFKETLNYHDIDLQHIKRNKNERAALGTLGNEFVTLEEVVKEWQMLARVLDRIFFCVVFVVMLFCALMILLSPFYLRTRSEQNYTESNTM